MSQDLKIIKKMYGEKMMHLCRELFPTLLETNELLSKLMLDNFEPSRLLYEDIIKSGNKSEFKNYIYSLVRGVKRVGMDTGKSPKELLEEAGYELYECKTESDIQYFKKYYTFKERLCTFRGERLDKCYVFFAVKKNVDEIKRENFINPEREDEYGTSVISIQFTKGEVNTLSIKNRYNHTVNNPDATFFNNLENIISGLTESFEKYYGLNINQNQNRGFELVNYIEAQDGKYYKYNYEINNIYYSPNNVIIDNFKVKKYDPEKYIVLDYFILDLQNKKIELYDKSIGDSFIDGIKDIEKINISKVEETGNKNIEIITKEEDRIIIEIDKTNKIIGYTNKKLEKVGNNFLIENNNLMKLDLPNLKEVEDGFLCNNVNLVDINLPSLVRVGDFFLQFNNKISNVAFPELVEVGNDFLGFNQCLVSLCLPNLQKAKDSFLTNNKILKKLYLPKLKEVGNYFLDFNYNLTHLNFPSLVHIGNYFFKNNTAIISINVPMLDEESKLLLEKKLNKINISFNSLYDSNINKASKCTLDLTYHEDNSKKGGIHTK